MSSFVSLRYLNYYLESISLIILIVVSSLEGVYHANSQKSKTLQYSKNVCV